jgi:hypothetical protein
VGEMDPKLSHGVGIAVETIHQRPILLRLPLVAWQAVWLQNPPRPALHRREAEVVGSDE